MSHGFAEILQHAEQLGFRAVHRRGLPQRPNAALPCEPSGLSNEEVLTPQPATRPDLSVARLLRRSA